MRKIIVLICFLFCAVNSFAVEKSRTFGNYTVYFDTEDVGKYYENPQKAALERDLVIYQEVPAYMIEIIKSGLTDSALSKKSEDEQNAFQCLKVIITNNLAGGRIYYKKEKLQISVFKDSEGNLYYADQKRVFKKIFRRL